MTRSYYVICEWLPVKLLHTKLHTYIQRDKKTPFHAMLAILFLIVFVTHFQLLLIQMPLRCVFLSEHNKSSYLPPAFFPLWGHSKTTWTKGAEGVLIINYFTIMPVHPWVQSLSKKICQQKRFRSIKRGTVSLCRSKGCKVMDNPIIQDSNLGRSWVVRLQQSGTISFKPPTLTAQYLFGKI